MKSLKPNCPRFIVTSPIGEDLFEGKSQDKIADAIIEYFSEYSYSGKIIGLDGGWGSGKSNVINIIDKRVNENVSKKEGKYVFTFDAWGHQEDNMRRAILEELTEELISTKDEVLKNDNSNWQIYKDTGTWEQKLKRLNAKYREIEKKISQS